MWYNGTVQPVYRTTTDSVGFHDRENKHAYCEDWDRLRVEFKCFWSDFHGPTNQVLGYGENYNIFLSQKQSGSQIHTRVTGTCEWLRLPESNLENILTCWNSYHELWNLLKAYRTLRLGRIHLDFVYAIFMPGWNCFRDANSIIYDMAADTQAPCVVMSSAIMVCIM